jgi:predicted acylesterase/phospholipase RssA
MNAQADGSMMQRAGEAAQRVASMVFAKPLRDAWFPILIALALFCALVLPGIASAQFREAFIDYAPHPETPWRTFRWLTAGLTIGAIWVLSAALRYWSARLLGADVRAASFPSMSAARRILLGVIWLSPWLGMGIALLQVNSALPAARMIAWTPYSALAACCLVLPVLAFATWSHPAAQAAIQRINQNRVLWAFSNWLLPISYIIAVFFFGSPQRNTVWGAPADAGGVAQILGPMGIFAFALAVFTAIGSWMLLFGRERRVPLFWIGVAAAVLCSAFNLNDNHPIRTMPRSPEHNRLLLEEAFSSWQALRAPPAEGETPPPLILVSAEGGGIRAAYMTAITLGRIADRCPAAANRIFAISGVSGGSVGAAVYTAAVDADPLDPNDARCDMSPADPGAYEQRIDRVFRRDHLSPIVARLLFPDTLQRFVPYPIDAFDRQLGLEFSLENAFEDAFGAETLSEPFYGVAPSAETPSTPFLFLNTTSVERGDRVFASRVYPLSEDFLNARSFDDVKFTIDMPLIAAAGASARFPYVSPTGRIDNGDATERFVDGGYFDNSGATTLAEIYNDLRRPEGSYGPAGSIIILHIGAVPNMDGRTASGRSFDEPFGPIRAILNTRTARITHTMEILKRATTRNFNTYGDEVMMIQIDRGEVPVPLGWFLSSRAADEMQRQLSLRSNEACDVWTGSENECILEWIGQRFAVAPAPTIQPSP